MELLERESPLDALDEVRAGKGRVVLIAGEAGIGTTAVVERFAEQHRARLPVLWIACDVLITARPLAPVYDIALQAMPALRGLLDSGTDLLTMLTPAIKRRLRELSAGQILEVRVDDPQAQEDITSWTRLSGHEWLAMVADSARGQGELHIYLRKKSG